MPLFLLRSLVRPALLCLPLCVTPAVLAAPAVQAGFSPEGSAPPLVISTLDSARESIRLMGYAFTSPEVAGALVAARRRGVDVRVVLDDKGNRSKTS